MLARWCMEDINYQGLINRQKNIYYMLCERIKNIMFRISRMGDYFVNNINHKSVNLYDDLFKMKRLSETIDNMLKNEHLTHSYFTLLGENNMRLDRLVESIENRLNVIVKTKDLEK